jgi:hypothetical protein
MFIYENEKNDRRMGGYQDSMDYVPVDPSREHGPSLQLHASLSS